MNKKNDCYVLQSFHFLIFILDVAAIRVSKLDNIIIIVHIELIEIEYREKRKFHDATFDA